MTTGPQSGTYAVARKRRGRFLVPLVILLGVLGVVAAAWEWYAQEDPAAPITQGCSGQYGPFFDRAGELLDQQKYEAAQAIFEVIREIEPGYPGLELQLKKSQRGVEGGEWAEDWLESSGTMLEAARDEREEKLREENAKQRDALIMARDALTQAAADVEEYRSGLNRCLAELNRQGRTYTPPATPRPKTTSSQIRAVFVRTPRAEQVSRTHWAVGGTLHNAGSETATGYVYVTLRCEGKEVGTERIALTVGAGVVDDYRVDFTPIMPSDSCSATSEWDTR